jgi:hypothetical protein
MLTILSADSALKIEPPTARVWPTIPPDEAENMALRAEVASLVASCSRAESEIARLSIRAAAGSPVFALVTFITGLVLGAALGAKP